MTSRRKHTGIEPAGRGLSACPIGFEDRGGHQDPKCFHLSRSAGDAVIILEIAPNARGDGHASDVAASLLWYVLRGVIMEETGGGRRLHEAIREALETAAQVGQLRGSTRQALEATLARLDEKLGAETTNVHLRVTPAPDQCMIIVHSSDPAALDIVASFMHHGGAHRPGSAQAWMLPLGGVPVNRWIRALRRVLSVERRHQGEDHRSLPVRLTILWSRDDALMIADVG